MYSVKYFFTSLLVFLFVGCSSEIESLTRKLVDNNRGLGLNESRIDINSDEFGHYYALVIGNNEYEYLTNLDTAIKDAKEVSYILHNKYSFKIKQLFNATRGEILSELGKYQNLKPNDNFLIYYAGHGEYDKESGVAYWLPIDAKKDSDINWIISDRITNLLKKIPAKHILIVADSCYSGTLAKSRSINNITSKYIQKILSQKSRTLLASGGEEPVSDSGKNGHSVFAYSFINKLNSNSKNILLADEIFMSIREEVAGNSDQVPEYNILKSSGHEGGDFVFVQKGLKPISTPIPTIDNSEIERVKRENEKIKRELENTKIVKENIRKKPELVKVRVEQKRPKKPKDYIEPDMVYIKGRSFMMGSSNHSDEKPIHKVNINYNFYIGKYEVTHKEFLKFINDKREGSINWFDTKSEDNDSHIKGSFPNYYIENGYENHPIIEVTWYGAKAYAKWLSQKSGKNYRLPTESEWEYVARAGTTTIWSFGNNKNKLSVYAWYDENSYNMGKDNEDYGTHSVGKKKPNPRKVYDMYGNVWEWCEDWYVDSYKTTPRDGTANMSGKKEYKVLRGGSWFNGSNFTRSANRSRVKPSNSFYDDGFRLLKTLE